VKIASTAISQTQSLVAKTVIGWSLFNDERETLIIMTRLPLRQFFLQNASLGAQSYYLSPWMVAVQCASDYVQSCEGNDLYGASLPQMGVLGWIQMWLRMAAKARRAKPRRLDALCARPSRMRSVGFLSAWGRHRLSEPSFCPGLHWE